jgi:hypothetical protein
MVSMLPSVVRKSQPEAHKHFNVNSKFLYHLRRDSSLIRVREHRCLIGAAHA